MKSLSLMSVRRVVRSSRSAAFKLALVLGEESLQRLLASAFFAKTRLVALPGCRRGRDQHGSGSGLATRQFDPLGINGGNHFIQLFLGRDDDPARGRDLAGLQQVLATLPNSSMVAAGLRSCRRYEQRGWPTSSMMKTSALPLRRRLQSSKVRSTTLLTEIDASRLRWSATKNPLKDRASDQADAEWRSHVTISAPRPGLFPNLCSEESCRWR